MAGGSADTQDTCKLVVWRVRTLLHGCLLSPANKDDEAHERQNDRKQMWLEGPCSCCGGQEGTLYSVMAGVVNGYVQMFPK